MPRVIWVGLIWQALLGACGGPEASDAEAPIVKGNKSELFDESRVVELRLDFAPDQWQLLQSYRAQQLKEYVHCSFRYGQDLFEDAACRSKGSEEDWSAEPKIQLIVKFNHWHKGGRFHGLDRKSVV